MGKNVYKEFRWEELQKMLKKESDKLARRQRAFRKKDNNAIDRYLENNFNEDLFQLTDKGYVSKGIEFYKNKNVNYLQKAIRTLEILNNTKTYKSVRDYEKVQTKKMDGIKQYIKDRLRAMGMSEERIQQILSDKNFIDNFIQILNDNTNSKLSSDEQLNPLFDSLMIEEKAMEESLNQVNVQGDITQRLFNR